MCSLSLAAGISSLQFAGMAGRALLKFLLSVAAAVEQRRFFCLQLSSRTLLLVNAPVLAAPGSCREGKGLFALQ